MSAVFAERAHGVLVAATNLKLHPEPDVGDLHRARRIHEKILGFQVVVRDAPAGLVRVVQPRDPRGDAPQNLHATLHGHARAPARDVLAKRLRAQLQRDEHVAGRDPPAVEKRNPRGLIQRREELNLAFHQFEQLATFLAGRSLNAFHRDGVPRARRVLHVPAEHVRSRGTHADHLLLVVHDGIADSAPPGGRSAARRRRGRAPRPGAATLDAAAAAHHRHLLPGASLVGNSLFPRARRLVREIRTASRRRLGVFLAAAAAQPREPLARSRAADVQFHLGIVPVKHIHLRLGIIRECLVRPAKQRSANALARRREGDARAESAAGVGGGSVPGAGVRLRPRRRRRRLGGCSAPGGHRLGHLFVFRVCDVEAVSNRREHLGGFGVWRAVGPRHL